MSYQQPAGWIPLPSAVDGLTLFGPAPSTERSEGSAAVCPSCGGPLAFDPTIQAAGCRACGNAESIRPAPVQGGAAHDFTLEALARRDRGWGTERSTLRCTQCGAEIDVELGTIATSCTFCASHQVERVSGVADAIRPEWVLPFQLPADELGRRVQAWLGKGWMHPGELRRQARVDRFVGVYLPYWLFDARTAATYQCQVGTDRQVTYTDGSGNRRTETQTSWSSRTGKGDWGWRNVPVPGTSRLPAVLLSRVQAVFDFSGLVAYDPSVLVGFQAKAYDVTLPDAWESGRARIRDQARQACERDACGSDGDHVRNMTMTASLSEETWRYALLPVYVSAYTFRGRTFRVLVNGQTGELQGQKPVVWWRIYALIPLFLLPGVCSGVAGIPFVFAGGAGVLILIAAVILLGTGLLFSGLLVQTANEAEAA